MLGKIEFNMRRSGKLCAGAMILGGALVLQACNTNNVLQQRVTSHGYQFNEDTLALVPEGSSREQVLLSLGTPNSTLNQPDGNETFYYVSQKRAKRAAFLQSQIVEQRVMAVYLNLEGNVSRIANYGLQDGKVFDFVRRVTPTGGKELSFLSQLLGAAATVANPLGSR